jgi:hypothetical protein
MDKGPCLSLLINITLFTYSSDGLSSPVVTQSRLFRIWQAFKREQHMVTSTEVGCRHEKRALASWNLVLQINSKSTAYGQRISRPWVFFLFVILFTTKLPFFLSLSLRMGLRLLLRPVFSCRIKHLFGEFSLDRLVGWGNSGGDNVHILVVCRIFMTWCLLLFAIRMCSRSGWRVMWWDQVSDVRGMDM